MSDRDLQQLYQEATAARDRDDCPAPETVAGAAERSLDPKAQDDVVSHMAGCADCAREYRIARSFRQTVEPPHTDRRWLLAAAAVIVLAATPLVIMNFRLRDHLGRVQAQLAIAQAPRRAPAPRPEPLAPQLGTPIADLDADSLRGEPGEAPVVTVSEGVSLLTLILHLPERRANVPANTPSNLNVELLDSAGRSLWRGRSAENGSSITITLPGSIVPAGQYFLRVGGAAFRFRVRYGA